MRIVALADTHGFHADLGAIPDGDVLICAGDVCRGGSLDELEASVAWLDALPHPHKLFVAGNHERCLEETPEAAESGTSVVYLRDSGVVIAGIEFWGSPWQPEFHSWAFNLPRGPALARMWALIPDSTDVLITHGPPLGVGDRTWDGRAVGCAELRAAAERVAPRLHVYGHIHAAGGAWAIGPTVFGNVTVDEGLRAPSVFDLVDGGVGMVSIPPAQAAHTH